MSTADVPSAVRARSRGFTVLESAIVTVIVGLMALVIERTISGITETERSLRAIRNTVERGQRAMSSLRDAASSSRKLFQNDAVGAAYLAKLDFGTAPLLPGSRLPVFEEVDPLGPDEAGSPRTGNVLLFVREADALPAIATAASQTVRSIDAYRLVCLYTTQTTRRVVAGAPLALDLVHWRSASFPSYGQVTSISDSTQRTNVVKDLYNRFGCDFLWDPTKPVATAFYGIDGNGVIAAVPTAVSSIPQDANVAGGPRFVQANMGVVRTDLTSKPRTPLFTVDDPLTWTPNGFEVKVCGPSGSRKIWMRLAVEQQASAGRIPAQETTAIVSTRDL
jgi:type II secretory pathway pseudopilin PulG